MAANKGTKVYISPTAVAADLDQAGFEAINDWVEISNVGTIPDKGRSESEITYPTLSHGIMKAKDSTDFGGGDIECAYIPDDPGQLAAETAAATELNYPFRFVSPDESATMTPTINYTRSMISGPNERGGSTGDFVIHVYTLMNNQHLRVRPTAKP